MASPGLLVQQRRLLDALLVGRGEPFLLPARAGHDGRQPEQDLRRRQHLRPTGTGTVTGIGHAKAEKIWYRALTVHDLFKLPLGADRPPNDPSVESNAVGYRLDPVNRPRSHPAAVTTGADGASLHVRSADQFSETFLPSFVLVERHGQVSLLAVGLRRSRHAPIVGLEEQRAIHLWVGRITHHRVDEHAHRIVGVRRIDLELAR